MTTESAKNFKQESGLESLPPDHQASVRLRYYCLSQRLSSHLSEVAHQTRVYNEVHDFPKVPPISRTIKYTTQAAAYKTILQKPMFCVRIIAIENCATVATSRGELKETTFGRAQNNDVIDGNPARFYKMITNRRLTLGFPYASPGMPPSINLHTIYTEHPSAPHRALLFYKIASPKYDLLFTPFIYTHFFFLLF